MNRTYSDLNTGLNGGLFRTTGPMGLGVKNPFLKIVEILNQIPEKIADPIMVFQSATVEKGVVVMTDLEHNGKTVVVAIHTEATMGDWSTAHKIASIYPRENDNVFTTWIEKGLLRYQNTEKAKGWFLSRGLQLPEGGNRPSAINILTEKDIVKRLT